LKKYSVFPKVLALLVLLSSVILLVDYGFPAWKMVKIASHSPQEWWDYSYPVEEFYQFRREILFQVILDISLIVVICSGLIVLFKKSRIWYIILGSASVASLIMFLIIFLKFSPFAFQEDIFGSIFFLFFCLINLLSAMYFLPKKTKF
jgi:hypothetical protein